MLFLLIHYNTYKYVVSISLSTLIPESLIFLCTYTFYLFNFGLDCKYKFKLGLEPFIITSRIILESAIL